MAAVANVLKLPDALSSMMFLTTKILQVIEASHDSEYTRKQNDRKSMMQNQFGEKNSIYKLNI